MYSLGISQDAHKPDIQGYKEKKKDYCPLMLKWNVISMTITRAKQF